MKGLFFLPTKTGGLQFWGISAIQVALELSSLQCDHIFHASNHPRNEFSGDESPGNACALLQISFWIILHTLHYNIKNPYQTREFNSSDNNQLKHLTTHSYENAKQQHIDSAYYS